MKTLSLFLAMSLATAGLAAAQDTFIAPGDVLDHPASWGGIQPRHSSTLQEGIRRGEADLARGVGDYHLSTAKARLVNEAARERYIANRLNYVQARFEMRRINQEFRKSQRPPRATTQEMVEFAAANDPERLAAHQFNPRTGELHWPAALRDAEFAELRAEMEAVYAQRSPGHYGVGTPLSEEAHRLSQAMLARLNAQVEDLEPKDWIESRNFLESVAYEVQFNPLDTIAG